MLSFRDLLCFNAISVLSRFTHFCVDRKWTQHSCLWSKYDVWVFCVGRITFKNIFTLWTLLGRNIFALFCCRDLPESSSESFLLQGFAWKFFWKFFAAGICLKVLLKVFCCRDVPENSSGGDRQRALTVPSHSQVLATIRVLHVPLFHFPHTWNLVFGISSPMDHLKVKLEIPVISIAMCAPA